MDSLGRHPYLPGRHVVFSRRKPEDRVEATSLRGDVALRPIQGAHRCDARALERSTARVGHVSPDAPRARLRGRVSRE